MIQINTCTLQPPRPLPSLIITLSLTEVGPSRKKETFRFFQLNVGKMKIYLSFLLLSLSLVIPMARVSQE